MTTTHDTHLDVAAYVLGRMDEAESEAFEGHLLGCARCTREAEQLAPTAQRLAVLAAPVHGDGDAEPGAEPDAARAPTVLGTLDADDELLSRTLAAVALRQRGERRVRLMFSLAASAAVIAGTGAVVASSSGGASAPQAAPAVSQPAGDVRAVTNPATGVKATASLRSKAWGTAVSLSLSGVKGPQRCRLIAIDHQGREHPMGDWKVPEPGYGVSGHPDPLALETSTDLDAALISKLTVRTTDGRDLATIAV
ncbi:zf-HC2 domain-containing protein [Streptomyces sp. NPDC002952]|uniref:zf-HC2 domain-containing protein n=1 Tax=Streptomyces sp. NPDC002952 TaxID=3364673 RepID=UPI0036C47B37